MILCFYSHKLLNMKNNSLLKVCYVLFLVSSLLIVTSCAQPTSFTANDSNGRINLTSSPFFNGIAKFFASDGKAKDTFGTAIATDGDVMVVGASGADSNYVGMGAAYIFERKANGWSFTQKLTPSDGKANDHFGISVTVHNSTVVIGANGSDNDSGAVYVFERLEGSDSWGEVQKLTAQDSTSNEFFGYSVAINNDTLAVGTPLSNDKGLISGSAYVFERSQEGWEQVQKLTATDGSIADSFGIKLALEDKVMVIGAWGDDDKGENSGSAYVFERIGKTWKQTDKLLANNGQANDSFGYSVDVHKGIIAIGSWGYDGGSTDSGSVYIFERAKNPSNWKQTNQLLAADAKEFASFGISVAVSSNKLVVGASGNSDNGKYSGAAYIFARSQESNNWHQIKKFTADDNNSFDFFSDPVDINGNTIVAGASVDDDRGPDSGSVYIYEMSSYN